MPELAAFWTRTNGKPINARVAAFKKDIRRRFPDFYGVARYEAKRIQVEQDDIIRRAIEEFPEIRELRKRLYGRPVDYKIFSSIKCQRRLQSYIRPVCAGILSCCP